MRRHCHCMRKLITFQQLIGNFWTLFASWNVNNTSDIHITHNIVVLNDSFIWNCKIYVWSQRSSTFGNANNNKWTFHVQCLTFQIYLFILFSSSSSNCWVGSCARCTVSVIVKWFIIISEAFQSKMHDHCVVNYKTIHIMWFYRFKSL